MALHGIRTVLAAATAEAASDRFEVAVVFAAAGVDAAEAGMADHCLAAGRDALGNELREREENNVDQPNRRLPAPDHRGRVRAVHDRTAGRVDGQHAIEAGVDGHIRIGQTLERKRARGKGLRVGRIHRRAALRVASAQVEMDPFVGNIDAHLQAYRHVSHAIIVQKTDGRARAARQLGDLRAAAPFGIGQQLVDVPEDGLGAQPVHQLAHAQHAGAISGYLGAEVAGGLAFRAHLGHDQLENVWNDFATLDQLTPGIWMPSW